MDTLSSYEAAIEFFVPDPDMKDAMVQLKSLVNTLPANTTENILNTFHNPTSMCNALALGQECTNAQAWPCG
uniref:Uteroglobin n=1 Tax=Ursus americanus TaxID=9643 RepID=A0A452ST43_URSAM